MKKKLHKLITCVHCIYHLIRKEKTVLPDFLICSLLQLLTHSNAKSNGTRPKFKSRKQVKPIKKLLSSPWFLLGLFSRSCLIRVCSPGHRERSGLTVLSKLKSSTQHAGNKPLWNSTQPDIMKRNYFYASCIAIYIHAHVQMWTRLDLTNDYLSPNKTMECRKTSAWRYLKSRVLDIILQNGKFWSAYRQKKRTYQPEFCEPGF